MSDTPTRRDVLKATATTGATAAIFSRKSTAGSPPSIHTVEAGIYYELDVGDDFRMLHLDSRPQFTINNEQEELWLADKIPQSRANAIVDAGGLFDEDPVAEGQSTNVQPGDRDTKELPTALSTRMRPMEGASLAVAHRLPKVILQRRGKKSRIVLPGHGSYELDPGTSQEFRLDQTTVDVTTVHVTDEKVPIPGRPEHRWGPKKEHDSVTVSATPVVRVVDHGALTLRRRELP